jgi:hypothetical protein
MKYIFYYVFLGTARPGEFGLERLDRILVLEPKVLLYMALKDYDRVGILL